MSTAAPMTARCKTIVTKAGRPSIHLRFQPLANDQALQSAVKAQRVMSVKQSNAGNKADVGSIGLDEEGADQVLIFPQSLEGFKSRRVVGIDYNLLKADEVRPAPKKAKPETEAPKVSWRRCPSR